jgi:hypothetical protein
LSSTNHRHQQTQHILNHSETIHGLRSHAPHVNNKLRLIPQTSKTSKTTTKHQNEQTNITNGLPATQGDEYFRKSPTMHATARTCALYQQQGVPTGPPLSVPTAVHAVSLTRESMVDIQHILICRQYRGRRSLQALEERPQPDLVERLEFDRQK